MARRITRKELKKDEFVDATVEAGHWIERNWSDVIKWVAGAVLVALLVLGALTYVRSQRGEAQDRLAATIQVYQQLETEEGGPSTSALEDLAKRFGEGGGTSTPEGILARFFEGSTLLRLGRLDEATQAFKDVVAVSQPTDTLGGTARTMLARAYMEAGQDQQAREVLDALLTEPRLVVPKDHVLLDLANLRERAGDREAARALLQRIVEEHPAGSVATEARRRLDPAS